MKEFIQEQTEQFEQVQKEHSIYIEGYTTKGQVCRTADQADKAPYFTDSDGC